jgi:multidrug efflux system outer membrane protein
MSNTMYKRAAAPLLLIAVLLLTISGCKFLQVAGKTENKHVPSRFATSADSTNSAQVKWREFFTDPYLVDLIDLALKNNQELNIVQQEIEIARNEVRARKGEYLPFVDVGAGAGVEKVGRYTFQGAAEASTEMSPGKEIPDPLPNFLVGADLSWEVDIWHKLRTAKEAAFKRYLATVEGRNFLVTNLVAEIANNYYELLALDNQLEIVRQNIDIQANALKIVQLQKTASRVTELAVKRFEAQVLHTRGLQFGIQQAIVETENRINFLVGRFPEPVARDAKSFNDLVPIQVLVGLPAQLLDNRPDVRQAEQALAASKLDVQVAKAQFYPSLSINAGIGLQAFNPAFLVTAPASLAFDMAGNLIAPLVNRNAIKAAYFSANAQQIQAAYDYERTLLKGYIEVANQVSNVSNLAQTHALKAQEVQALNQSIAISNELFNSARADYMEVLLTQRDALEARFDLIDIQKQRLNAVVDIYQALGGGWN